MRAPPPSLLRWILAYPFLRKSWGANTTRWMATATSGKSQLCRHSTYRLASFQGGFLPTRSNNPAKKHRALFSTPSQHYYSPDILTSAASTTVKRFLGLQQKAKNRREAGETVVEGPRIVLDLLKNPDTRPLVQQIIVATDLEDEIREELDTCLRNGHSSSELEKLAVHLALPNVIKACSDTVTPQGILARVQIPPWDVEKIGQRQTTTQQPSPAPLYLLLDGVSDPGNLGTLLRSSVAVGVTAVLLLPGSCDVWNPKAVRSAMGGSFLVPTFTLPSWEDALQQLDDWHCQQVWAATMLKDGSGRVVSSAHYDVDWNAKPQALVIGNEGNGLSPPIRESLDSQGGAVRAVHVPMEGAIESLNAAVCGSVILFEYMRQWQQ